MEILARCPACDAGLPVPAADEVGSIACGRCGRVIPLTISDAVRADRTVDVCPICQGSDFYLRKDFNPKLGVAVVVVGALVSAACYWRGLDVAAYGVLGGAAVVDLVVYQLLRDMTVCYRCHAEFRGAYGRTASGFDLHTADVLEQEYERKIGRR